MRLLLAAALAGLTAIAAAQGNLSKEERSRLKAEAARPPSAAEKKKMAERAKRLDYFTLCTEAGRALRAPRKTASGRYWDNLVVARANIPAGDVGYIRQKRLVNGMDECSAVAILGKPDAAVADAVGDMGKQLVYRQRGIFVYTDKGVVRAWQD
jgi:hypothetical protein